LRQQDCFGSKVVYPKIKNHKSAIKNLKSSIKNYKPKSFLVSTSYAYEFAPVRLRRKETSLVVTGGPAKQPRRTPKIINPKSEIKNQKFAS
jgi:hypothetical protein